MTTDKAVSELLYHIDCYDEEANEALVMAITALRGQDAVKHFLDAEIWITSERLADKMNPCYDGVCVGRVEAEKLKKNHIRFCKQVLSFMERGERR